jgi:hypothetical protein
MVAYECLEMQGIMAKHGVREAEGIWNRIGTIVAEYSYLQIAKIHDPAGSDKNANLSLDWFIYKCVGTKKS